MAYRSSRIKKKKMINSKNTKCTRNKVMANVKIKLDKGQTQRAHEFCYLATAITNENKAIKNNNNETQRQNKLPREKKRTFLIDKRRSMTLKTSFIKPYVLLYSCDT